MAAQVLSLTNLSTVPFKEKVESIIRSAFAPLVDSGDLKIDTSGTAAKPDHVLNFVATHAWNQFDRRGCLHKPIFFGVTGDVLVETIERKNYCDNVKRCDTCTTVFRRSADELGKMIGVVAIHEIGHLLNLMEEASFTGANGEGHSADPANGMFAINRHKDYNPIEEGGPRTKKYTIVKDDTLSGIAHRIGFWPAGTVGWKFLYDLKGKDGKRNRELLRGKTAHEIWPGEEIWVPDRDAWVAFYRKAFLQDKSFNDEQIATMRKFIKSGGSIIKLGTGTP